MKVKNIISEERISLPEVRDILQKVEADRLVNGEEMSYELRRSIESANQLSRTDVDNIGSLIEALQGLEKMKPDIAYRIANTLPKTRD